MIEQLTVRGPHDTSHAAKDPSEDEDESEEEKQKEDSLKKVDDISIDKEGDLNASLKKLSVNAEQAS